MEPTESPALPPAVENERRASIRTEGKQWAQNVNEENAWDKLVLTLGEFSADLKTVYEDLANTWQMVAASEDTRASSS